MGASGDRETLDLEGERALAHVLRGLGGKAEPIRVGRYELGELLGRGAFGQVFVASDPELGREVAIKLVAGRSGSEASQSRLLREGQALAQLQHPHVVPVYDVGIGELGVGRRSGVYIVMERVHGRTLAAWQAEVDRTPPEIVAAYGQAARGLAAAHAAGVVHRDFKPANAMVRPSGTVVVIDFGLATAPGDVSGSPVSSDPGGGSSGSSGSSLTETGTVMGTPRYMAPEQHRAEPATPSTDQYAWCVALWEALAGSPPFSGRTYAELVAAKTRGALPHAPALPASIRRVLGRGLSVDPARRFASMSDLLAELGHAPRRRRRFRVALAAVSTSAIVAALLAGPAERPGVCDLASPRPASRVEVEAALLEARPLLAALATSDPAMQRQERFVAAWDEAREELCAEPATEQATIRSACLQRAKRTYEHARDLLDRAPREDAPWILDLWTLPSPERCAGADAATAFVAVDEPAPDHATVRAELERLAFEVPLPPPPTMQATIDRALAIAERSGDPMLGALGQLVAARGRVFAGERVPAADVAVEAAWRAQTAGDQILATEILLEGLGYLMVRGTAPDDVDRLLRSARELARAAGDPPLLLASLDRRRAEALHVRGDLEPALAAYSEIAARHQEHPDPAMTQFLTNALGQRGDLLWALDRPWAAKRSYEEAIASVASRDADVLRAYVDDLHARLAEVSIRVGDLDTAATAALTAMKAVSDPRTGRARALSTLGLYGWILALRGQPDEGRAHVGAAVEALRRSKMHRLGRELHHLARLNTLDGRPAEAIPLVEEMRTLAADDPLADPSTVAAAWAWLARLHARVGELDRAAEALSRAEEIVARSGDAPATPFDASRVGLPAARAEVALARGDFGTARDQILVALADPELHDGTPLARGDLGDGYALLSRALAGLGHIEEARAVSTLADEAYAGADALRRSRPRQTD